MIKREIDISVHKGRNFDVPQKRYDIIEVRSIVNTQVIQDIVEGVLERGCVSVIGEEIANSY